MSPMFVPGPVDVAPVVLAAQAKPMMPHRSKDFEELFRRPSIGYFRVLHRAQECKKPVFATLLRKAFFPA
jgi:aspartate aminotransferase-like enzyme